MTTTGQAPETAAAAPRSYRNGSVPANFLTSTDRKVTGHTADPAPGVGKLSRRPVGR